MVGAVRARTRFVESRHLYDLSATYVANGAAFQPICRKSGPYDQRGACACFNMKNNPSSVLFSTLPRGRLKKTSRRLVPEDDERGRQRSRGKIDDAFNMSMSERREKESRRANGGGFNPRVPYGNGCVTNRNVKNQD